MPETLDLDVLMKAAAQAARRNDPADAARLLRQALALQQQLVGANHPDLAPNLNNLALMLERQGDVAEAERCYRQAYAIAWRGRGRNDPLATAARANLVEFLHATGKLDPLRDDIGNDDGLIEAADEPASSHAVNDEPRMALESPPRPMPPSVTPAPPMPVSPPVPDSSPESLQEFAAGPPPGPPPRAARQQGSQYRVPPAPPARPVQGARMWLTAGIAAALGVVAWLTIWPSGPSSPRTTPDSAAPPPAASTPAAPVEPPPAEPPAAPAAREPAAVPAPSRAQPDTPAATAATLTAEASLCVTLNRSAGAWRCDPLANPGGADAVYYYTRVKSPRDVSIRHRWTHEGKVVQTVTLQVRANTREGFRTFSRQRVAGRPGAWEATLLTADGTVVDTHRFTVPADGR